MYQLNEFADRSALDQTLADNVADILADAIKHKGKASIAVSGGSTPKGFSLFYRKKILLGIKLLLP